MVKESECLTGAESIRERLVYLCALIAPRVGRYEWLAGRTDINSTKWKNVFLRRQMPTLEMLIAIGKMHFSYCEWLLTGYVQDDAGVQRCPDEDEWIRFEKYRQWIDLKKIDEEIDERKSAVYDNDAGNTKASMEKLGRAVKKMKQTQ
jgi:hypothetical protein